MVGTLFARATVTGLLVAMAGAGCGTTEVAAPGEDRPRLPIHATDGATPGQPTPGELAPGEPTPGEPTPGELAPGESASDGPNPGGGIPEGPQPGSPPSPPPELEVAWVPPGPGGGHGPRPGPPADSERYRWHEAFDDRDCEAIAALGPQRDEQQLYRGLGAACRAVLKDGDRWWPVAEAALQRVDDPADCLDRSALRLLRDLVTAHQRAPDAEIRIVNPPGGRKCDPDGPTPSETPSGRPGESSQPTAPSTPSRPSE